ncbi:MAG: Ig-like domain-containing protein [Oscillospiraceae bacterium]
MKSEDTTIYATDRLQLSVRVKPASFTGGVVWSSSDETVATVDKNGIVTGVAPGTATITATSVDKRSDGTASSASVEITVKGPDSLDTEVSGSAARSLLEDRPPADGWTST